VEIPLVATYFAMDFGRTKEPLRLTVPIGLFAEFWC